jgi:hypothetical protein
MSDIKFNIPKVTAPFPKLVPLPPPFKIPSLQFPFLPGFSPTSGIPVLPPPTMASEKLERDINYAFSKWEESFFVPGADKERRKATKTLAADMTSAIKEYVESCQVLIKPGQQVDTSIPILISAPPPAPPVSPHYHKPGKTLTVGVGRIIDSPITTIEIERHVDPDEFLPDSKLVRQKIKTIIKTVDTTPINRQEIAQPSTI